MEELELRFGSNLRLSERERVGIQIAAEECGDLWKGSLVTLVARVLTTRAVQSEGFISMFTRLWSGMDGVSIKEIGERRFLVRFANKKDKLRVLDMEPWTYRESLVLLAETLVGMDAREMEVGHCTFWVQFHGIPPFSMATLVARKIGSLIGRVMEVDKAEGDDCIGRFLRVRLQLDVRQPLMRGAFVQFPDEGSKWVTFRYEYLPEYCFICGCLGHPSRICVEKLAEDRVPADTKKEILKSYAGLEAEEDLRGRRLRSGGRGGFRRGAGSDGSRNGGRWRNHESDDPRDSGIYGRGGVWRPNDLGSSPGRLARDETMPSQASLLAERIRLERDIEERERRMGEEAWDAGLLVRPEDISTNIQEELPTNRGVQEELEEVGEPEKARLSDKGGSLRVGFADSDVPATENGDITVLGLPSQMGLGTDQVNCTQGSDPFNLGPIIEQSMPRSFQGKQRRKNKRDYAETMINGQD